MDEEDITKLVAYIADMPNNTRLEFKQFLFGDYCDGCDCLKY